jgi:hypothetical protein
MHRAAGAPAWFGSVVVSVVCGQRVKILLFCVVAGLQLLRYAVLAPHIIAAVFIAAATAVVEGNSVWLLSVPAQLCGSIIALLPYPSQALQLGVCLHQQNAMGFLLCCSGCSVLQV